MRLRDNPPMPSDDPVCPVCGSTRWEPGAEPFMLREADPRVMRGGGMPVVAFFCSGCNFTRLHRVNDGSPSHGPS